MNRQGLIITIMIFSSSLYGWSESLTFYQPVLEKSQLQVKVYRAGALKGMSHDHLVEAKNYKLEVKFQPENPESISVDFEVQTNQLTVIDPRSKPQVRAKVEKDMKSEKVLDMTPYPTVTFAGKRFHN